MWKNTIPRGGFRWLTVLLLTGQFLCGLTAGLADGITFQTNSYSVKLGSDAIWQSLVEKKSGRSLLATDRKTSFAYLKLDGKTFSANSARREAGRLVIGFGGVDTKTEYLVEHRPGNRTAR